MSEGQQLPPLPDDAGSEIVTARLALEPMKREHAEAMFPVLADARLYEFTGDAPPPSVASLEATYAFRESRRSPDGRELWLNWVIRERERGEPIGTVQATVLPGHAYVAWIVGIPWQGAGYASEAAIALVQWLRNLGVAEVRACVNPAHTASRNVARNAGMQLTGDVADGEEVWARRWAP